jgi:glutamine synthetase
VLSSRELEARQEVFFDLYFKTVNIEGETTEWIAQTQILPGALRHLREMKETGVEIAGVQRAVTEMAGAVNALSDAIVELRAQNMELGGDDVHSKSRHMRDNVIPAMNKVRVASDALERITAHDHWPLPSYREMLFVK